VRVQRPMHRKHVRMISKRGINLAQGFARLGDAVQPEPANGGIEMM